MAWTRPTLVELKSRIQQDFVSSLSFAGSVLRRSMVFALSRALAGASHMLHGHLEWSARQAFTDTSDREALLLDGRSFGVDLNEATFATGDVTFAGTNGTVIPLGTVLVRSDGVTYATTEEVTIAAGTATASVEATEAAADGNCDAGVVLTFESPVAGADSDSTVAAGGLSAGADEEDLEAYRLRVLDRKRTPPHGGSKNDFIAWAKEVSGVTRAWSYPRELGAGSVTVRFMRDNDGSGAAAIPSAGEVATVQAYLDDPARKPVTAVVTVVAPVAVTRNFTIDNLLPDTAATRAAIQAELEDLIKTVAPGGTLLWSQMHEAIASAADVTDFFLTSPAADVTYTTGQIPVMGTITWT